MRENEKKSSRRFYFFEKRNEEMISIIKELFCRFKDAIFYLIFGIFTTLVNIISYWVGAHLLCLSIMLSTMVAWFLAVLFAYLTNRSLVFHSEATETVEIIKEILSFFSCRLATGIFDWICMFLFVEILNLNDLFMKIITNIGVIILNYVASKLIIFKKNNC